MPFESEAQRRFMYANHPAMARRWEKHTHGKDLPERVGKLTGPTPVLSAARLLGKVTTGPNMTVGAGATGPSNHTPEMLDFASLYAQPESKRRQRQEAKQSATRRRSTWRDLDFGGLYGAQDDKPLLRYGMGKTSIADAAITQPRHYLTAKELRESKDRIAQGLGYDDVQTGRAKRSKV